MLANSRKSPEDEGRGRVILFSTTLPTSSAFRGRIVSHRPVVVGVLFLLASWSLATPIARGQSPRIAEQGIVFVAPASGDFRLVVTSTEHAVTHARLPLRVAVADWASGDIPEDIRNHARHLRGGWHLAQHVLAYHQVCPGRKVFLIGHSGGTAVCLAATRWLPPNSVERIILLSPGVSSHHDLRRALVVSRCGIDNFFSRDDAFLAGIVDFFGNNDGRGTRSAGEVGFVPIITSPTDALLYRKLRQYPWRDEYSDHGYHAGHFGVAGPLFLSHAIVPLLAAP